MIYMGIRAPGRWNSGIPEPPQIEYDEAVERGLIPANEIDEPETRDTEEYDD